MNHVQNTAKWSCESFTFAALARQTPPVRKAENCRDLGERFTPIAIRQSLKLRIGHST